MPQPATNLPIAYDNHGNVPFEVPFSQIPPHEISIYLQLDTRVGKETCGQVCGHCLFNNVPAARGRSIDLREGRKIMDDLCALGYKVFPMISDSFSGNGEFMTLFGSTHMREYCQGDDQQSTRTMLKGELWSSGAPLMRENWRDLLAQAVENGFGSVTLTFHGQLDEDLALLPRSVYPIAGVFPGDRCVEVIGRIARFNAELRGGTPFRPGLREPLEVNVVVTLGRHNHTLKDLTRYTGYFNKLPVDVVRFNAFHDYGFHYPQLPLAQEGIARVYKNLKWIHTHLPLNFQMGIDEDMGTSGIEVMGFPAHTGMCRAGRQLFAVVPDEAEIVSEDPVGRVERVGTVAACVDAFHPQVGYLRRETKRNGQEAAYSLAFDHHGIDRLVQKRLDGSYRNGCFAHDLLAQSRDGERGPRDASGNLADCGL